MKKSLIKITSLIMTCVFVIMAYGCGSGNQTTLISTGMSVSSPATSTISGTPPPFEESSGTSKSTSAIFDLDRDGISDEAEDRLIRKFAPVVRFHPNEQYLPAEISWYLGRVRMRFDVNRGIDHRIMDKGTVTMPDLITKKDSSQSSGLSAAGSNFFLEQTDIDGGDKLDSYRLETRKGNSPSDWVVYAHVKPADKHPEMFDIQYIFFYAYNGDMLKTPVETAHEADMEHITVRVEQDMNTIYQIYYAAHDGEGRWFERQTDGIEDGFKLTADSRPIVYSAINSHASYPTAGRKDRGTELPDDETGDGGLEWNCSQAAFNLGEKKYPREGTQWIQYSGHWGEVGETGFTTGPYGPAYQKWWDSEPE